MQERRCGGSCGLSRLATAMGLAAALCAANSAWGQGNNNNGGNNGGGGNVNIVSGQLPAGVVISPDGVLRVKQFNDPTGQLTRTRIAEARARLGGGGVAKVSELRKISLNRLEAALAAQLAAKKEPTDEMKYLAGLTRVQYVFYYPETKDVVLAGPAEGFFADPSGRVLGMNSGRAVVELQDLVAALRAFPPEGKQAHTIMVSIDPTQEGLARMAKWLSSIRPGPGDAAAIVEGLKQQLGLQNVTIDGVSPRTHFAQVMVEADYRMKLIGIGIEPPPVKMATYIGVATQNESLQRWFFTPKYDCVRVAEDNLAMELVGQGVKLIGESELVAADGARKTTGGNQSRASKAFCEAFTSNYPQIAARNAVYAQLKNLIDVSIAAAFIQKQDYYGQAGWKLETFGDERKYSIETFEAPKTVETACTAVWKGNRLMTPVGGGVQIQPLEAVSSHNLLRDDKGAVKQAKAKTTLGNLANGQWWWD